MFTYFYETPAHAVVANKRCRYHFSAIFRKKYARLAIISLIRQQQVGKLLQALLPFSVIVYCVDWRKHVIGDTVFRGWVVDNFIFCVHISSNVAGNVHHQRRALPTTQRWNQQRTCLTCARRSQHKNVPLVLFGGICPQAESFAKHNTSCLPFWFISNIWFLQYAWDMLASSLYADHQNEYRQQNHRHHHQI